MQNPFKARQRREAQMAEWKRIAQHATIVAACKRAALIKGV